MKQWTKYIICIMALSLFCMGCADEDLIKVSEGTIGNKEIYTTLRFGHQSFEEVNVASRGDLGVVAESRVQNLFVYLFVGESCVYTQYFDK